jgi:diguanylate cyclase (GGDEF)-like protein
MANRFAIVEDVDATIARAEPGRMTVAILDIDGFTQINEVLGHANGDKFLRHVAAIIDGAVTDGCSTARIGADQFAIARPSDAEPAIGVVVDRIRLALLDELELDGVTVTAEITVGCVEDDTTIGASELLRRAGVACRAAKQVNAPQLSYEPGQEGFDADRLTLVAELRHAIDDGQLVLHYQPKVDAADGVVTSVEALVRWQHPTRGLLPPGAFVPAAESTELIISLTDWVVDRACAQAATWRAQGMPLPIAVNVSARCLRDHEFADRMLAALQRHDVTSDLITIEITETAVIADPDRAAATLRRLAERGMGVAIDDFGVGYTSLAQLDHLPISELKIDREFVAHMTRGADGDAVVRAVVSLGHGLGMTVVAEGVEDDATLTLLAEIGCDIAQGYAIARPAPAETFEAWLRERRATADTPVSSPV